ncbi:hypothetical protein DITRI_Ditri06bG0160300 [Diplodiscus trichospermus]
MIRNSIPQSFQSIFFKSCFSLMTLFFSHLLPFFFCTILFLFALKMIIISYYYCYYYYSHFMLMMMKKYFCRTTVQSMAFPSSKCGLGLISNETQARVADIPNMTSPSKKKDPGGIGFIDGMGGGVDGLMSCTESLGFESCDERRVDDDGGGGGGGGGGGDGDKQFCASESDRWRRKRSEEKVRERNKKFPPPLSSLNQNGQPCFYLKPVRKNGRLELTEVRLPRPEILRAIRENGRLRLHLVCSHVCSSKIDEEEENEETKPEEQLQEEEEEDVEELWKYRVNNGEGFWRCHELVNSHLHHHRHHINDHHNSFHVWRQPCLTR